MNIIARFLIVILASGVILGCKPTKICPAYHSYFILDEDVTRSTFSLFGADSLPKDPHSELWQIEKKKVGIADDLPVKKKEKKQRIITMESIYLQQEDPLDAMAMAEMDSVTRDSLQQAQPRQHDDFYNFDQMIYLHHFGKYFPRPKPEPDMSDELKDEKDEPMIDEGEAQEEEKGGFLKNLFGGNKKKDQGGDEASDEAEEDGN